MARKRILWLASWYPSVAEPFNGDFIQRHANAAALYDDIYVIHVIGDGKRKIKKPVEDKTEQKPGLTERIIVYKKSMSFAGRVLSNIRLASYFRKAIADYIQQFGLPDLVHVQVPLKAGIIALWMKAKYGSHYFVTEHWGIYNRVLPDNFATHKPIFKSYTKEIIEKAGIFITPSQYLGTGINEMVVKKDFTIIPNAVNTDLFFYKEKEKTIFRFIHVSNMVPLKNAEGILRAAAILARNEKFELIMVGDTEKSIHSLASELRLLNTTVFFRGEIAYGDVAKEMQQADAFILFSNIENSPCVIGEALCCGLPVIATNVGGISELVNESNGFLINAGDEYQLAAMMKKMMDGTTHFDYEKIAEDARSKFSYSVIGKQFSDLYSSAAV
ncbi:MAG: glycosyltransferase [Bacteroidetes bacterium]|nr:glycosyltransferase [Bacteroidota bacterium]